MPPCPSIVALTSALKRRIGRLARRGTLQNVGRIHQASGQLADILFLEQQLGCDVCLAHRSRAGFSPTALCSLAAEQESGPTVTACAPIKPALALAREKYSLKCSSQLNSAVFYSIATYFASRSLVTAAKARQLLSHRPSPAPLAAISSSQRTAATWMKGSPPPVSIADWRAEMDAEEPMRSTLKYLEKFTNHERKGVPKGAGTDSEEGFPLRRMEHLMQRLGDPVSRLKASGWRYQSTVAWVSQSECIGGTRHCRVRIAAASWRWISNGFNLSQWNR